MHEFDIKRRALLDHRETLRGHEDYVYGRRQSILILTRRLEERIAQRPGGGRMEDESEWETIQTLAQQLLDRQALLAQDQERTATIEATLDELGGPEEIVAANWRDDLPVLLAPVRVHTRFVRVKHLMPASRQYLLELNQEEYRAIPQISASTGEAWQKEETHQIYPLSHLEELVDEAHQDLLGSNLLNFELNNLIRAQQWPMEQADTYELFIRIYPDDFFIYGHEANLTYQELQDGMAFWRKLWEISAQVSEQAQEEALITAWEKLQEAHLPARAAWIHRATKPTNYSQPLSTEALAAGPEFDLRAIPLKQDDWSRPRRSYHLPDRFVVRLTHAWVPAGADQEEEVVGQRIVYPLALSHDPGVPQGGDAPPEELKWMTDFELAERVGLGIRIPLHRQAYEQGIDQIVVLGVHTSLDEHEGQAALEELWQNHQYKHDGMALAAMGTATNNFAKTSSAFSFGGPAPAQIFPLVHKGLSAEAPHWFQKRDAHYLSELLGIELSTVAHLYGADNQDISGSLAMNHVLWEATIGYYLEQFFTPMISKESIEDLRVFFQSYVTGRGLLPILQIGQQPYGILTTTNYKKLDLKYTRSGPSARWSTVERMYQYVLQPLDEYWERLLPNVKHLGHPDLVADKYDGEFLRMLGLQASAASFKQQALVGKYLTWNSYAAQFNPSDFDKNKRFPYIELEGGRKLDKWAIPFITGEQYGKADFISTELKAQFLSFFGKGPYGRFQEEVESMRFFDQHFPVGHRELLGEVVDGLSASLVRPLDSQSDSTNYLRELLEVNSQTIAQQFGPEADAKPEGVPLLRLLIQQAIGRLYVQAGLAPTAPTTGIDARRIDFELEHLEENGHWGVEQQQYLANQGISEQQLFSSDRWQHLSSTPDLDQRVTDLISLFKTATDAATINTASAQNPASLTQLAIAKLALELLSTQSTLSLHHLFTEHLDLGHYRLDAWFQALAHQRLLTNRAETPKGLYLGAYGYLDAVRRAESEAIRYEVIELADIEETRSKGHSIIPVLHTASFSEENLDLDAVLANAYVYLGKHPGHEILLDTNGQLVAEPITAANNQGFIQTPSRDHAVAAAILRAGYMGNNQEEHFDTFAVNLSSQRTRAALRLIEGVRQGQTIEALLGYQFERLLGSEMDGVLNRYIYELRAAFPINTPQEVDETQPLAHHQALQVVDGLALVRLYRQYEGHVNRIVGTAAIATLGLPDQISKESLVRVLSQVSEQLDAVSDLLLSESVFQVAKGNLRQAATTLKMFNNEAPLATPEIVQSPQQKQLLSHLLGIVLDTELDGPAWGGVLTPLAKLCPQLNHWIGQQLPPRAKITIKTQQADGRIKKVDMVDLDLEPIDFVRMFHGVDPFSETSELSQRIRAYLAATYPESAAEEVTILYYDRDGFSPTQRSIYSLLPLIQAINELLQSSRPMLPTDLQRDTNLTSEDAEKMPTLSNDRLLAVFAELGASAALEERGILSVTNKLEQWEMLQQLAVDMFGEGCPVVPEFTLPNASEIQTAQEFPDLLRDAADFAVEEWLQGLAQVRSSIKVFQQLGQYRSLLLTTQLEDLQILQLPTVSPSTSYRWLGVAFPEDSVISDDNLSLALQLPVNYRPEGRQAGLVVDSWKEHLPVQSHTAALALHYDQPNTEPPQSLLLCVAPARNGYWQWDDLMDTITDTMHRIKKRAIDPDLIHSPPPEDVPAGEILRYLLPATVLPVSASGLTPSTNLNANNPVTENS